jgi:hypothetical protein
MNVATQRRSDLSTIAPDRSAARMPGTGPLRRSSGPLRNQAIVGKSRIGATLHRCERPVFVLHTNHFPVAGTLDQAQTFLFTLSSATQQYEPPSNTAKSSLKLIPKRDIHAEPLQDHQHLGGSLRGHPQYRALPHAQWRGHSKIFSTRICRRTEETLP